MCMLMYVHTHTDILMDKIFTLCHRIRSENNFLSQFSLSPMCLSWIKLGASALAASIFTY